MRLRLGFAVLVVVAVALCFISCQVIAAEAGEKGTEAKVTLNELPAAVKATLMREAQGGKIEEIEKNVDGSMVTYSADIVKGDKTFDVLIGADGSLINVEEDKPGEEAKEGCHGKKACGKNEGKEENEVKVTFADLPPAVQAALQQEAGSGTIDEIEKATEGGQVIYSADITKDGRKYDVDIAADGKLIKSKVEKPKCTKSAKPCEEKEGDEKDEAGE